MKHGFFEEEKMNQAAGAAHFAFDTQDYAAVWLGGMTPQKEKKGFDERVVWDHF